MRVFSDVLCNKFTCRPKSPYSTATQLKYNTLSCSKVLQDDPCMTNCHTANHNLNVMHHASLLCNSSTHAPSKLKLDLELMRSDRVVVSLSVDNAEWTV